MPRLVIMSRLKITQHRDGSGLVKADTHLIQDGMGWGGMTCTMPIGPKDPTVFVRKNVG